MKKVDIVKIERGYDFISIYIDKSNDIYGVTNTLYKHLKRYSLIPYEIQRKDFGHIPGDPLHFHNHELPPEGTRHFHVLYEERPSEGQVDLLVNVILELPGFDVKLKTTTVEAVS